MPHATEYFAQSKVTAGPKGTKLHLQLHSILGKANTFVRPTVSEFISAKSSM